MEYIVRKGKDSSVKKIDTKKNAKPTKLKLIKKCRSLSILVFVSRSKYILIILVTGSFYND